ncbi:MAG: hydrolase [Chlorobi bacterium]|nr:hydrolase [Chlorobiota bacterium]
MRVLKENSIALIIDIQEKLYPFIFKNSELTHNLEILIKGLKALDIPFIVTEQYTKGLGPTIEPVKLNLGEFEVNEKMSFSCCDNHQINESLAFNAKYNVIIAGIEAHVCVLQTVIDLIESGYKPIVVEDCIASRTENNKKIAIERMQQAGAIITTYESILFELCRYSGTDVFRVISKLVK